MIPISAKTGKKKLARPVKAPKSPEVRYRHQIQALTVSLRRDVNNLITPLLVQLESEYVNDAYASALEVAFENLRKLYSGIEKQAKFAANSFVDDTNNTNKNRFYASMEDAVGVNLASIIQDEGLTDVLTSAVNINVTLISNIPKEYFKKVEILVYNSTTQGNTATSMIKEIRKIGKKLTFEQAKLIARDQSSKLNSVLNQQRQQNLGVEEYVWRTSGDERVRQTHKSKNGKTFRWDKPPKDTGHPGEDVQCRCVAQPIIRI